MEEKRIQLEKELKKAEETYQTAIKDMQAIFTEELYRRENEGPFRTETELDNFNNYYMNQKQLQNEVFIKSKRHLEQVQKRLDSLDKQMAKEKEIGLQVAKPKELIKFKPLEKKVAISSVSEIQEPQEERLVVSNDIKALVPTELKADVKSPVVEEEPIAKKVDLKEISPKTEKPIWEQEIVFPPVETVDEDIEIPNFPRFPFEEIEKLLEKPIEKGSSEKQEIIDIYSNSNPEETGIDEIEVIKLPSEEEQKTKEKPRVELVDEFIYYYDEPPKGKLTATNIEATSAFKKEMKENKYLYNIVKKVPQFIKAPFKMLKKISDRIVHTVSAKLKIKNIKEKILAYTDEDILIINDAFEEKGNTYPTVSKVMITEAKETKKENTEELNVELPNKIIENLTQQINDEFRKLGKTEEEIAEINRAAEERARARIESEKKGYCTTEEEILAQVESALNERKSQASIKK